MGYTFNLNGLQSDGWDQAMKNATFIDSKPVNTNLPTIARGGSANNTINLSSTHISRAPIGPAPAGPDLANLRSIQADVQRKSAIKTAMREYDELEASTRATGFQAANNAGTTYANRLMQSGVNPLASGVVAAQARMPVYKNIAEIGVQRENTRLDATNRADSLAAQIATTIGQLQANYAKTLADFNVQSAGYEIDVNKFNAGQTSRAAEAQQQRELESARLAASIAASGGGGGRSGGVTTSVKGRDPDQDRYDFNPGYITNAGPIRPGSGYAMANGNNVYMGQPSMFGGKRGVADAMYARG